MSISIEIDIANELTDGSKKKISVRGRDILLAKVEGKYYAVDNRCPHFGGDLSKGKLDGYTIICPQHGAEFDLRDGRVIRWTNWSGIKLNLARVFKSPKALETYSAKADGDKIIVE